MAITIGELAKLTGVTVRALHHYDEIGLVVPSARSPAGYRLYADEDVLRLQQVLVLRELELPLPDIARVLAGDEPRDALLARHRELLVAKRGRLDAVIASIDRAIGRKDEPMTRDEMKQLFDGFDPTAYEDEVKERWGETDAYQESARRTARYGKAEWTQIKQEAEAIDLALVAKLRGGVAVEDPEVQALVEQHRLHIERWFYPCSIAMHQQLGAMYVADARFQQNLDKLAAGYADYLSRAIAASTARSR